MRIDVIIPNYNGSALITKNLPSVINSLASYPDSKIIIVDDGSGREDFRRTLEFVTNLSDKQLTVELIRKEKNSGFSSTVNMGALKSEANFLVLLNTDVVPEKEFLKPIFEDFAKNENLFAIGCMDKSVEGDKIVLRGRGEVFWSRGFLVHKRGEVDRNDTFWVSGGSSVVRADIFKKLLGFDTIYDPFYWEDIDLSFRARKAGYGLMFENKSIAVHKHTEGAIKKYFSPFKVQRIGYRNQFVFVWKNITDRKLLLSHFLWLPYHILMSLLRLDFAFILGLLLAASKLPVIIKKRSSQKRFYKKGDNEIINNSSSI